MSEFRLDLQPRIHRLERLLAIAFVFALVPWIAVGFCVWKITRPDLTVTGTLVAQAIEVRTSEGKAMVKMSANPQTGELTLNGGEGKAVVKLTGGGIGGNVELLTRAGTPFARLGPGTGKGPALDLHNSDGKRIVYLGNETEGDGNLTIATKDGHVAVVLRNNDGHGGGVGLYRDETHLLAFLGGGAHGEGALQIADVGGKDYFRVMTNETQKGFVQLGRPDGGIVEIGTSEEDAPYVSLNAPRSKAYAYISSTKEGGEWKLSDSKGRLRAMSGWVKDGTAAFKLFGADGKEVAIACENATGGFFQTYGRNGNATFSAGCDDDDGSGELSLFHAGGPAILWAGLAGDDSGGLIKLKDVKGKVLLQAP